MNDMSAIKSPIKDFIFKTKVKDFKDIKGPILSDIEAMGTYSMVNDHQKISNTDWHLNSDYDRSYWNHAIGAVDLHNQSLRETHEYDRCSVANYWFQQYERGDYHKWHNHSLACFSNVFYIELNNGASKTSFKWQGIIFDMPVEEGDIISFPAFLAHSSKPNQGKRKTVISFNSIVEC
mgnify:CR=1 FL=1